MEMHSRQSLHEIHGIGIERRRSRLIAWRLIARIVAFLKRVKRAIETELTVRRAMTDLADMDDHMLRDLGIHLSQIEIWVRWPRARVGTNDTSVFSNDTGERHPVLPVLNSPDIGCHAQPEQEQRKHPSLWK